MTEQAPYRSPDLEELESMRVFRQAWHLRRLVKVHPTVFADRNPGSFSQSYPRTVRNVVRLARDSNIAAFLIFPGEEDHEPAVGVGTVIWNRKLEIHPVGGGRPRKGIFTDVHYRVGRSLHNDAHREIGNFLVSHATLTRPDDRVIVTTPTEQPFPQGFNVRNGFTDSSTLNPVVIHSIGGDPYGVTRGGSQVNIRLRWPNAL